MLRQLGFVLLVGFVLIVVGGLMRSDTGVDIARFGVLIFLIVLVLVALYALVRFIKAAARD